MYQFVTVLLILSPDSIINMSKNDQALVSRAKVTALKYEKYCKKLQAKKTSQRDRWMEKCVRSLDNLLTKAWKTIMPKCVTGPSTPYQELLGCIAQLSVKKKIQNLPFSQLSINEAVVGTRIKLIVTYTKRSLASTLDKIDNNQQINALLNKKSVVIPVRISQHPQNEAQSKLKELIESLRSSVRYEQQVFLIWKGLFSQIVVVAHFQLSDPNLCQRVLEAVQEREDFEQLVQVIAGGGQQQQWDQSSLNKLSEQSTEIQKDLEN